MPIRFRCAFCKQLMGISRRKAGTVVSCPTCHGQVMVPEPGPPASPSPAKPPNQNPFERQDFDPSVFDPRPVKTQAGAVNPPPPNAEFDVEPVVLPASVHEATAVLPRRTLLLLLVGALLLAAVAFGAGFALAKLL